MTETDPSEPKIVHLFRGVELVPDERGGPHAAWIGPVWVTLWRQECEAVWHHAAATMLDDSTGGRVHVQVKSLIPGAALEKLDRLVGRFSEWEMGEDHPSALPPAEYMAKSLAPAHPDD